MTGDLEIRCSYEHAFRDFDGSTGAMPCVEPVTMVVLDKTPLWMLGSGNDDPQDYYQATLIQTFLGYCEEHGRDAVLDAMADGEIFKTARIEP